MTCPDCGEQAKFVDYRSCEIMTLMGEAVYERAYYHCSHCKHGHCPTDEEFGLEDKHTPGAEEVISMVGATAAFAEGAHVELAKLTGLTLSASSVQRITERIGDEVARQRTAGETFGPDEVWTWPPDANGLTTAYVGLDAISVRQQGPHAEPAEGRMPLVALVFRDNAKTTKHSHRGARYVAGLVDLPAIGQQLRDECIAVGIDRADQVNALTDGGAGFEERITAALAGIAKHVNFILDFWHAAEHLEEFAKVFVRDETIRQAQVKTWCHLMKHAGGHVMLRELESLDLTKASPLIIEAHRQLTGYVRNNVHRMDYPTYVRNGWQIGSGRVESACNSVVGCRLKGPGMRWHEPGTNALSHLRALFKSEPSAWHHFWSREKPQPPTPAKQPACLLS